MSNQVAELQLEIDRLHDQVRAQERQVQAAGNQYNLGALGALAGLLLTVFVSNVWWLGLLLFLAGALAVVTQGGKKRAAQRQIKTLEERIDYYRREQATALSKS